MSKKMMVMVGCCLVLTLSGCGNQGKTDKQTDTQLTESQDVPQAVLPSLTEEADEAEKTDVFTGEELHFAPADLTCVLPDGFRDNGDNEGLYVYKTYPKDTSTISHVISDEGEDITQWSADVFKEELEQAYYDSYGEEVEIKIVQDDALITDGRPGFRILLEFTFKGVDYEQLMYAFFNGDEVHYLYYTEKKGGKWLDAFYESGETIHFVDRE